MRSCLQPLATFTTFIFFFTNKNYTTLSRFSKRVTRFILPIRTLLGQ